MIRWLTTPLLPGDFTELVSPLWSRSAPRGRVVAVRRETARASSLRVRTGRGWPGRVTRPGQFVRIGVDIDGVRHWRSYSLTSVPGTLRSPEIEVTVQAKPDGLVSGRLAHGTGVGDLLHLGGPPAGDFVLPDPVPGRLLMITAGSGITPVMAMLRGLAARGEMPDTVLLHSAPRPADVIFAEELRELAERHPALRRDIRHTATDGRLDLGELDRVCPDWADRAAFVCGPAGLRDAALARWRDHPAGHPERLRTEGFTPPPRHGRGIGGRVTYGASAAVDVGGATSLLEAGEAAGLILPSGCRMGICFGCVLPLRVGQVRDLRSGRVHGEPGDPIQTCVNGAAGPASLDL